MTSLSERLWEGWLPIWESFLDTVEPHLPEYLHWNELCWTFVIYLNEVRLYIHDQTRGLENWEIVVNTITYCFYVFLLFEVLRRIIPFVFFNDKGFFNMMKSFTFWAVRKLPVIGDKIQERVDKTINEIKESGFTTNGQQYIEQLPYLGKKPEELKASIKEYQQIGGDDWNHGYASGTIYMADKELTQLMTDVYNEYVWSNPLHFDIFPDVRKMEAEVVSMCIRLYNGDSYCCGAMTTGGTESIMLACKCYQELGRQRGISVPEIIAPYSVHPAFDKACHFFGMKLTHVPVDKTTGRADIKATKRAISRRTILLVGSVPSFPHGCIDPMEDLAKLARKYNLYLHADCCLGGFLLPFMRKAGFELPCLFDFRLPEITSISCDTHKYGFTPKGSSVIMYKSKEIRKFQYFTQPNWSGGVYASASLPGSRAGNTIATTWAAMLYHGEKGYIETTRKVIETTRFIHKKLAAIPGIRILAPVDVSVVAFTSDYFDIFIVSNEMSKRKWHLSPLQFPSGIHITVTMQHTQKGVAERLIKDIREIADKLMQLPPGQKADGQGAIYGLSQQIPDRSIISDITTAFLDTYYSCSAGIKSVK